MYPIPNHLFFFFPFTFLKMSTLKEMRAHMYPGLLRRRRWISESSQNCPEVVGRWGGRILPPFGTRPSRSIPSALMCAEAASDGPASHSPPRLPAPDWHTHTQRHGSDFQTPLPSFAGTVFFYFFGLILHTP